ncbi:MAG TPA: hypothetical protein VNT99_19060 [Methylomirabilota bacterium]|nr:hypothetical protein [Methylomirabilota bacterium]
MKEVEKVTWRNSPWTIVIGFPLLVVFALAFVVLPGSKRHHHHRRDPSASCRVNLRQIELVKKLWAEDENKTTNDVPAHADLFGADNYLKQDLSCPAGGTYTLGSVGEKPRCSVPGHSL